MTTKTVDAVVRGPMPYFGKDGVLYVPGQVVRDVRAEDVTKEPTHDITVEVEAKNGDLRDRTVAVRSVFAPLDSKSSVVEGEVTTATAATGEPDRLNVTDLLKRSDVDVIATIMSGSVDDHLSAIEQAVISGKGKGGRIDIRNAIAARMGDLRPVR